LIDPFAITREDQTGVASDGLCIWFEDIRGCDIRELRLLVGGEIDPLQDIAGVGIDNDQFARFAGCHQQSIGGRDSHYLWPKTWQIDLLSDGG
jgi:hypothetical protein